MEATRARGGRTNGWASGFVLGAITALWGIRGAPRCPTAAARAAATITVLIGDAWGPRPARDRLRG
eukprot:7315936-Lingulodinium_polyedra.AAC.1